MSTPENVSSDVSDVLARAEEVIHWITDAEPPPFENTPEGHLHVGVDLGTAYLSIVILDQRNQPIAGEYQFAQVVRDGLVVDFIGAVDLVQQMKNLLEQRLGRVITRAASGFPPGVPQVEIRAVANVLEAAGMECTCLIDEPTAANALLGLTSGGIVDVGGGTTGLAILKDGQVVYTADEPTGGTHFTLVTAGSLDVTFEEAEAIKVDPNQQARLFPLLRPVMEKVGSIINHHIRRSGIHVDKLALVGGSSAFHGMSNVIEEYTGLPTFVPEHPVFVTPVGIAMHDKEVNNRG